MSDSMLREEIKVYSDKYGVDGIVRDYGVVVKLFFSYQGKSHVIGITRNLFDGETYEDLGRDLIETYISELSKYDQGRKLELHYWYIEEREIEGTLVKIGNGIVTGHKKIPDSSFTYTSAVQSLYVDEDNHELIIVSKNSVYHAPLEYCNFERQDKYPDIVPNYDEIKKNYLNKIPHTSIEPGKILLVLSDFCSYYFHSIYYVPENAKVQKPLKYSAYANIGTFQDSFLIYIEDTEIDIRYWPHFKNIEFYALAREKKPLFIENIGGSPIYAELRYGTIKIEPGERKEVKKENVEAEVPVLPGGDLYPAAIIEDALKSNQM